MSTAIQLIIDVHVRFNDRKSLVELKAHREDVLAKLNAQKGCFDPNRSIGQVEEELRQIEAGLTKLNAPPYSEIPR